MLVLVNRIKFRFPSGCFAHGQWKTGLEPISRRRLLDFQASQTTVFLPVLLFKHATDVRHGLWGKWTSVPLPLTP